MIIMFLFVNLTGVEFDKKMNTYNNKGTINFFYSLFGRVKKYSYANFK